VRRVGWTPEAIHALADIRAYTLRTRGASAAQDIVGRLRRATRILHEHPRIGRAGAEPGTRELPGVHPFVIVYRTREDTPDHPGSIEILRIWHGAQDRVPDDPPAG